MISSFVTLIQQREYFFLISTVSIVFFISEIQAQSLDSYTEQKDGAISLLGGHAVHPTQTADIWGYADPVSGREYALVGYGYFASAPSSGLVILDVTNPANPVKVSEIDSVPGFDVKIWENYVYTVSGSSSGSNGRVVDISDIANPAVVGSFPPAHNIFISDNGYLILAAPGIRIFDLNLDPKAPVFVWSDNQNRGHDAAVIGNRLFDFHGTSGTFIYDFSDPSSPQLLGAITDPAIRYHHSGWTTADGKYLLINDELARHPTPDITIWEISDIGNPQRVAEFADPTSIVHNLQIVANYALISYYTAGFRILDISDPRNPIEVETFDTSFSVGESYDGAFGVYAFSPSKNIFISDGQQGLFVFSFAGISTGIENGNTGLPTKYALLDNYPNPFNPGTTITYLLPEQSTVRLTIYNILGQPVRTLVDASQEAGEYRLSWDGLNDQNRNVASGVYFYRLDTGKFSQTKRMLMMR